MTDMAIMACAPLPGQGLVARRGDLVVVTDGRFDGLDPLLGAIEEAAGGDGAVLVVAAARALLTHPGQYSAACAGVTADGEVAVLVHGGAHATVAVDDKPEVVLTASGSVLPVSRTFSGSTVRAWLVSGGQAAPDSRLWLREGVVRGDGLALTIACAADVPGSGLPGRSLPGAGAGAVGPGSPGPGNAGVPGAGAASTALAGAEAGGSRAAGAEAVGAEVDGAAADGAAADRAAQAVIAGPGGRDPGPAQDMPGGDAAAEAAAGRGAAVAPAPSEWWLPSGQDLAPVQGDDWRPPTFVMPDTGPSGTIGRPASPGEAGAFAASPPGDDRQEAPAPGRDGQDEQAPTADSRAPGPGEPDGAGPRAGEPTVVDGVMCSRNHFNDPDSRYCMECGIAMGQAGHGRQQGPRPSLGTLLLDEGTEFPLDRDYVVGREPMLDDDVAAGRATPLRIPDPGGTVSRLHLRISLVGWQVEVRDLNSSNGSVLRLPDGSERRLPPGESAVIPPATKIVIGHRSVQYQPSQPDLDPHSSR
jgi:hypothetical protein